MVPWIPRLYPQMSELEKINHAWIQNDTAETLGRCQHGHKACRTLVRNSKRDCEKRITSEAMISLKQKLKWKNIGPLTDEIVVLTEGGRDTARILNTNFALHSRPGTLSQSPRLLCRRGDHTPGISTLWEQLVQKYFEKLDTNKSTQRDKLSPRLSKELEQQIRKIFNNIFNLSLQIDNWKRTNVTSD